MLIKPKQIVQNAIKYLSSIFPASNFVNLFHAASKDKKVKISFKRLNQVERSSCKLFGQCANIPTTLMSHHGYHSYSIKVIQEIWINSRKLNRHLHLE